MKNAILLHGRPDKEEYYDPSVPSASNAHWFAWLQKQLLVHDILAATPEVPFAYDCNWQTWQREVERFDIGPETTLVGHSTGAGFWLKYLSIHPQLRVDKVVLIAPWLDPEHETRNFFDDFEIDADLASRTKGVTIFHSNNDMKTVQETVDAVRTRIKNLQYKEFEGYGHFGFEDMKTIEFPELLAELL